MDKPFAEDFGGYGEKEAPRSAVQCCGAALRVCVTTIVMSMLYVPFLLAVLFQTLREREGFPTTEWESKLTRGSWVAAFTTYTVLLGLPVGVFFLPQSSLLYAVVVYYGLILAMHVLTFFYASTMPSMCSVHRFTEINWRSKQNLLAVFMPFAEVYQVAGFMRTRAFSANTNNFFGIALLRFDFWDIQYGLIVGYVIVTIYWVLVGLAIAIEMKPESALAVVVFDIIPGLLFLPIVNTQLWLFTYSFDSYLIFLGLLAFLFFTATAPFVGTYRSNEISSRKSILYIPVFNVIDRSAKCLAAVLNVFFTALHDYNAARLGSLIGVFTLLLILLIHTQPGSTPRVMLIRVLCMTTAIWGLTASLVSEITNDWQWLWRTMLAWPLVAIAVVMLHRRAERSVLLREFGYGAIGHPLT